MYLLEIFFFAVYTIYLACLSWKSLKQSNLCSVVQTFKWYKITLLIFFPISLLIAFISHNFSCVYFTHIILF